MPLLRQAQRSPYQGHHGDGFAGPLVSPPVGESGEAASGVFHLSSSARDRVSGTDVARLFFGYFLLASLKESKSPAGARPGLPPEKNTASQPNTRQKCLDPNNFHAAEGCKPRVCR